MILDYPDPRGGGGGGGGSLIFSYIRRLGSFFGVQNFDFYYFGGFQKNEYFWGMKILWIFFILKKKMRVSPTPHLES